MPKRIATPPPGDDEPKYLTVVHPYAIDGTSNMELQKDRRDFALWVACCIDKDAFFAIFHKPSARGMVIIEVSRSFAHFDRILGEHRWSEFLQKPTEDEEGQVTKVFYCAYNTGRIVQKNGWKRIDVDEAWFKTWSPKNRHIKFPYPSPHFCDVPVEDQTNHSLCRPLPGAVKVTPVEVIAPQPIVGSAEWIQGKEGGSFPAIVTAQSKPKSAWDKGAPKVQAALAKSNPTANGSVKKTIGVPREAYNSVRTPAIGGGPIAVKSSNVWQNTGRKAVSTPGMANWDESPQVSRGNTPVSRAISPGTTQTLVVPHPPGPASKASVAQGVLDRAGNSSIASWWDSAGNSTSSPDSESGPDPITATESDNPYAVQIKFSESMEEEFHGMGIRAIEDEDDLGELDSIAPGGWDAPGAWEETNDASWDDDTGDAESLWRQNQNQEAVKPVLCQAHGVICKKGICAEYAKQLRLVKRAEEEEKRKAAIANKGKKGPRGRGRGAGKKRDENGNGNSEKRSAAENNPFRGPGAPVRTTWRGVARPRVPSERPETTKAAALGDGWGGSDSEVEPNAAVVTDSTQPAAPASDASWGISENAYDPWSSATQPVTKPNRSGGKAQNKKKLQPVQAKASSTWADQVEAQLAAPGTDSDELSGVTSKRGSKRGTSIASLGTNTAKTSTSGWGDVPEMPW